MKNHFRGAIVGLAISLGLQFLLFLGLYGGRGTFVVPGGGKAAFLFLPSFLVMLMAALLAAFEEKP